MATKDRWLSAHGDFHATLAAAREYVAEEGNESGGSLHIVLDDGNTEAHFVGMCIRRAALSGDADGAELGIRLLALSETQRLKIAHQVWKPADAS